MNIRQGSAWPFILILLGASVWGFIWYPMRTLVDMHVSAAAATLLTGLSAAVFMALLLRGALRKIPFHPLVIGLLCAGGVTSVSFYWGVTHGSVMRVLLLFYLSPVWTAGFAYLLLREPLTRRALGLAALSVAGAGLMLWTPGDILPLPNTLAEWAGLAAGMGFALHNVLALRSSRELPAMAPGARTFLLFSGSALLSLLVIVLQAALQHAGWQVPRSSGSAMWHLSTVEPVAKLWLPIIGLGIAVGIVTALANLMVQYGLPHVPANRASLFMLFEIVVTALSAWLLASEVPSMREWLGGGCIVLSTVLASR